MSHHRSPRGFTLIEITIAVALLALFLVIALGSITNITTLFQQAQTVQNNQQAALVMIETIRREAEFASSVQAVAVNVSPGPNDVLNGLCINRGSNGQTLFFIATDPSTSVAKYKNPPSNANNLIGYENDQIDGPNGFYKATGRPSYIRNSTDYFAVKHLYQSDDCSIADVSQKNHVSQVGGNSALINNTNTQFFSVQTVTTKTLDSQSQSFAIGLEVTQIGPPGIVIGANNPGKQFDDNVVMRTVIFPNVLP